MSNTWPGCIKIHEGCGGHVRWVEAVQRPGVGYHGHCLECDASRLPVEEIVPVRLPDDTRQAYEHEYWTEHDLGEWRELAWNRDQEFEANQQRIHRRLDA